MDIGHTFASHQGAGMEGEEEEGVGAEAGIHLCSDSC